jgi:tRNA pseudouridine38-40 synthase
MTAFHRWQKLDYEAMSAAAALLTGTHDFTSFSKPGHGRASAVRTVSEFSMSYRGHQLVFGVSGSGFLWNQIRIMVGTVIEVGLGRFTAEDVGRMLAAKDRRVSGSTAPPHGLYLQWIQHKLPEIPRPPRDKATEAGADARALAGEQETDVEDGAEE